MKKKKKTWTLLRGGWRCPPLRIPRFNAHTFYDARSDDYNALTNWPPIGPPCTKKNRLLSPLSGHPLVSWSAIRGERYGAGNHYKTQRFIFILSHVWFAPQTSPVLLEEDAGYY